jgi:uncharacterized membrane protein YhaH (DUF805 family)
MLQSIKHGLGNLHRFRGRESRVQFWPYAIAILLAAFAAIALATVPLVSDTIARMQRFAAEHPELATVEQGPGHYSIRIEGHHPELMPDMAAFAWRLLPVMAVVVVLLGAAVTRRLHDTGRSGAWGLTPLVFLTIGLVMMPRVFNGFVKAEPELGLFFALFFNNLLYLGSLLVLAIFLASVGTAGANRYGPAGGPPPP